MFKEKVVELLKKEVSLEKEEILKLLEKPPRAELGDYAFPCFALAPKLKKNPAEIASDISRKLNTKLPKEIVGVKAVNAYVNFFVNNSLLAAQVLQDVLKKKDKYGSTGIGKGTKMLIEHTSINPNSPPHIGTARGALIGDSLVRALRFQDYKVEVHYYINDVSKQVALLVLSCKGNEKFDNMLDIYVKAAKKLERSKKFEQDVFSLLNKFEKHDKSTEKRFKRIVKTCVDGQRKVLSQLGIKYDKFDYESDYLGRKLKDIIAELKVSGKLFKDEHGRWVLNQQDTGLEKEMRHPVLVLTRSDGTGLYVLRDMVYTIDKLKKSNLNIVVLGEEQKLYFKQLKEALAVLKFSAPQVLHYSHVLITTGEGRRRMSKRRGELILLDEFINEAVKKASEEIKKRKSKGDAEAIGLAAVKYAILHTERNKNVAFDWQQALNFEGSSGPCLQYAYARASSILRKANKENGKNKLRGKANVSLLKHEKEIALINHLAGFPDICISVAKQLAPNLIADYSYKLTQLFNDFYENCPVLKANPDEREARLVIVKATRQVLGNALNLLGIKPLERM